mgnify:FL=1
MITERTKYYDKIIINFANPDMVGHTGVEAAAIKAIEVVDECVGRAVEALKEKKGYDVKVIDISEISILADYFIIANGSNANQVQAMVDNVEEQMYKAGFDDPKVEGYNNASWILLDYNDVVLHIFDEESRSFYNLERLWRDGKEVDVDTL